MADNSKIKDGLRDLANKIGDQIKDLASLEVTTYSGDFKLGIAEMKEENEDAFKIKSLLESKPATINSELKLVAYSRFEIDSDASNIVSDTLTEDDKVLVEVHKEMVTAAQEARKAMFEFAKSLIKIP